jgi:hypothetical protein
VIALFFELVVWMIRIAIVATIAVVAAIAWAYAAIARTVHAHRVSKDPAASEEASKLIAVLVMAGVIGLLALVGAVAGNGSGDGGAQNDNEARREVGVPGQAHPHVEARSAAHHRATERRRHERERERSRRQAERERRRKHRQQQAAAVAAAGACPSAAKTLDGVYHPDRLSVMDPCFHAAGTVTESTVEEDGDLHFDVALEQPYRSMLLSGNRTAQNGDLVVELMPRDYGHIDAPSTGDHVDIVGAYVNDTLHGWAELHPVWSLTINGTPGGTSGPQYGGSPPTALSDNALSTCHTNTGARCHGYDGSVAPPPEPEGSDTGGEPAGSTGGGSCDPNYSGCVPPYPPDVDCAQVNGPVKVLGSDPHGLDADGDGVGCES